MMLVLTAAAQCRKAEPGMSPELLSLSACSMPAPQTGDLDLLVFGTPDVVTRKGIRPLVPLHAPYAFLEGTGHP